GLPVLSVSPGALSLTGPVNGPLQPQALVVTNAGAGVLQVTAVQAPAPVEVMSAGTPGGGTCPPPPFSLQPGVSCTLMVGASGPVNATLQLSSNASATPASVTVTGTPLGNAGGGGCSIGPPGRPADPVWALMLCAAAAVLWRRRARAAQALRRDRPRQ
ncbi:MAG: JDVT-CTERM domain-containing protein, partial [Nevskia sp.]|nr:JDVT-CTERM domain-containing protein [Nevskia sp.]